MDVHISISVDEVRSIHSDLAILHCVSQYPCRVEDLQLDKLRVLTEAYSDAAIGLSDHFNGILTGPVAYMLGARIFEKHVTFDRSLKGTDHAFSLEPDGFRRLVRDIKRTQIMLRPKPEYDHGSEPVFKKLGKSLIARKDIHIGTAVTIDDVDSKIFVVNGIPVRDSFKLIGKTAQRTIVAGEKLEWSCLS